MEIEEYLLHKEKRLEKGSERIKDFRVFDFNFIPEKPLMRDEVKPVGTHPTRATKKRRNLPE
ncbi:MAG: hypothetical protein Q8Q12_11430 [bacterium]|nr:hypothetical protein [bacterium]